MKKAGIILLTALLTALMLCGCGEKEEFPKATEKFYVNDFANVIDDSAETEIFNKAAALDKATTAQVVVVTVNDLGGKEAGEYATELGRSWNVGNKEKNNGIVILLSRDDRDIFIAVGDGLGGALPDSKTGRIIDIWGLEDLKADRFSDGLLAISDAVINEVYIEYDLQPAEGYVPVDQMPEEADASPVTVLVSWVIMIGIIVLISLMSRRTGRRFFFFGGSTFMGGTSGRSGGSFGGFSGGGGSFGGGGAGRGF